jgi:hypothetical protein
VEVLLVVDAAELLLTADEELVVAKKVVLAYLPKSRSSTQELTGSAES